MYLTKSIKRRSALKLVCYPTYVEILYSSENKHIIYHKPIYRVFGGEKVKALAFSVSSLVFGYRLEANC
jgi:hypothetical protein